MNSRAWSEKYWTDPEQARILAEEGAVLDAADLITEFLEEYQISRSELAERLKMKKPAISRALNGESNMTLRTLGRLAWGLGMSVSFSLIPARVSAWQRLRIVWVRPSHHKEQDWRTQLTSQDENRVDVAGTGVAA